MSVRAQRQTRSNLDPPLFLTTKPATYLYLGAKRAIATDPRGECWRDVAEQEAIFGWSGGRVASLHARAPKRATRDAQAYEQRLNRCYPHPEGNYPHLAKAERKQRLNFGGGGRTRTYEGVSQRIYSPPPLPLGTLPRNRAA